MKEEFDRKPGLNPAGWKYGIGWEDGALQKKLHQTFMLNGTHAWYIDGAGRVAGRAASGRRRDLSGRARAEPARLPEGGGAARARTRRPSGAGSSARWAATDRRCRRSGCASSRSRWGKYRVDATINKENLLQRIHTWVPSETLGDMNYEHEFTERQLCDVGDGIRFPTGWHSHQGWDDNFGAQAVTAGHNAFGGTLKDVQANVCPDPVTVPDAVRRRPSRCASTCRRWPTACICWPAARTTASPSSSRRSSPSSTRRSAKRGASRSSRRSCGGFPNKPIRFVVNSHQHFDHTGGLRAYNHIGATVITHWKNFDFLNRDVINYAPRTLRPDMVSLWPPTELAEGYYFETVRENYVHHRRRADDARALREPAASTPRAC